MQRERERERSVGDKRLLGAARETRVIVKAVKKGGNAQSKVSPQPKRGSGTAKVCVA
jgi:hypothetical protein